MPHLSIEHDGTHYMTALEGSLEMGRKVSRRRGLRITDDGVSRRHAGIQQTGAGFVLADYQSTNGTFVNGRRIDNKHALRDGDRIRIGRTRLFFHDTERPQLTCGICQSAIADDEATSVCPDCDLIFHADCWQENLGCAAYGCKQVNALADGQSPAAIETIEENDETEKLPGGSVLLATAVAGTVIGALLFGVPAAVVAILAALSWRKSRSSRALWAAILGLLGAIAGAGVSYVWWFQ